MPEELLHLVTNPEEWRMAICSCTNCDSYNCFALRHESAAGCTCNVCQHSKTCLFYNNLKANLNAPEVKKPGRISYQDIGTPVSTPKCKSPLNDNKEQCESNLSQKGGNTDTLLFYENIKARLEEAQAAINELSSSQDIPHKPVSQMPLTTTLKTPPKASPTPSSKTLPKTHQKESSGMPSQTTKKTTPSNRPVSQTPVTTTLKPPPKVSPMLSPKTSPKLPQKDSSGMPSQTTKKTTQSNKPVSQTPLTTTLKPPPKVSPMLSPKTLPKIPKKESSEMPSQPTKKTTPSDTNMKIKRLKACGCKISKSCQYHNKGKAHSSEQAAAYINNASSSFQHTPTNMYSINNTVSNETIKKYRVVPIVDESHTDYIKLESDETYYEDYSNESAPVHANQMKAEHTPKTEQDLKFKKTHGSDDLSLSESELKRYERLVKVIKHVLEKNQEKDRNTNLQKKINNDKIHKKDTGKISVDQVSNLRNITVDNISEKTSNNVRNINEASQRKEDEYDFIDKSKYVVDSNNIPKREKSTGNYPDYGIRNTSSKCKSKFCTLRVDEGEKPFRKRVELQIVYDIRGNENITNQNNGIDIKPIQNISQPCSHTKTSAELSAQIMNVPYKEYTQYISQPESTPKQKGSKYILKKIKDIYEACSCKVCECISSVVPTYKTEVCNCKPCNCDECQGYGKGSKKTVSDTLKKNIFFFNSKSENCDCKPCECIECKSAKFSGSCSCKSCECIECKHRSIKKYRKYIVAPVEENQQRNICDCSPCGCFECAHPYGTVASTRTTQETSTEVHRHLNCHCHPCNNVDCEQEGLDTCNCDRHSKVMRKPVLKDTQEYDIHHVRLSGIGSDAYKSQKTNIDDEAWLFKSTKKTNSENYITNVADALCTQFGCKETKVVLPSVYQSKKISDEGCLCLNASQEQSPHGSNIKVIDQVSTRFGRKRCKRFGCKETTVQDPSLGVYQPDLDLNTRQKAITKKDAAHLISSASKKNSKPDDGNNNNVNAPDVISAQFGCKETPLSSSKERLVHDGNVNVCVCELNSDAYQSQKIDKRDAAWLFSAVRNVNSKDDDNTNVTDDELYTQFGCKDTVAIALNLTNNFPTATYVDDVKKSVVCNCKPCECLKCLKHYKECHNPNERTMKNCYCEICECINCESMFDDSLSACDCKPCDCIHCQKFLPSRLRTSACQSSAYTRLNKETVYPCMNNSNSRYISLLNAKDSYKFLDKIITDKESRNNLQRNDYDYLYKQHSFKTIPQVDMYCKITNNNKYINKSQKNINEEFKTDKTNVLKDKICNYISRNKSNVPKVNENTKIRYSKEKKTATKSKNVDPCTCESSMSFEPFSSGLTRVKECCRITRTELKNRDAKSRESSCNSSGHDYSNYLIRFPKSTVDTCISDVMNLNNDEISAFTPVEQSEANPASEYNTSTISGYLHNTLVLKDKYSSLKRDSSKQGSTKLSNFKRCKNWNSESPCDCQPCDCDKCSYKTIKYDRCRCDCNGCFCYGTCLSEDKSIYIRKNELTQTLESQQSGEVSWDSDHDINPETKTLVKQCYPTWNTQELEVSRDKDIQSKKSYQIFTNKNITDMRKSPLYKNDNCVINSCVNTSYYDSVSHTLRDAKAFSLELLRTLQKYEKANRDFDSMSKKFYIIHESLLSSDIEVEKRGSNNLVATEKIQLIKNELADSQCYRDSGSTNKIKAVKSGTAVSLETVPTTISTNFVDSKNERNKILIDIYDLTRPEVIPVTFEDQNHEQVNSELKVKLDNLQNQFKMYSKLINRAIIKCKKEKWKKTCGSGSNSKSASRDNSRNYNNSTQNNHDAKVSSHSNQTKDETKKESNILNTVYLNTVDPRDLDNVSTDKTLDFENNRDNSSSNSKKDSLFDKEQLTTSNTNINVSYPNLVLEKEDALIDIPASFNEAMDCVSPDGRVYQKMSFSKGYYNIMNQDFEEASTSQDETNKTEFQRKFESMPSVPQKKGSLLTGDNSSIEKIASSNIVKTPSNYDPKKVTFQTVRKLSDHTLLVKWKVPLITTDIEGYELLLNGRSVQKVLSPTHDMAVVTCLPHTNKVLLTVRTITLTSATTGNYPATTTVYRLRAK